MTCDELITLLDQWAGRALSVRVVSDGDDLLTVFHAKLGGRSVAKRPAIFWPLLPFAPGARSPRAETPGIYLHPDLLQEARLHVDATIVDIRQGGVKTSLRRL
ncbi:MAG: hypothetical protein M3350_06635 [Actinomycetota bacterium]|nr:hypothetical protein [Actinomycetota bacterium]